MLQKQRTYTLNFHLCCKCKLKKSVISNLSTGTASLEYYISGSPNSKMIRSSEWGQTHHSSADCTLSRHQNAQSLLPFGTWANINKSWASIKTGWDMMCLTHTSSSIVSPYRSFWPWWGQQTLSLHRKEKVFGLRVNMEQSSATKAVFKETRS